MYPGKWPVARNGPSSTLWIKTINYGVTAGLTSTEGGRKAQHPSKLTSRSSLLTLHTWAKACITGGRVRTYHMNSSAEPSRTSHSGSHASCYSTVGHNTEAQSDWPMPPELMMPLSSCPGQMCFCHLGNQIPLIHFTYVTYVPSQLSILQDSGSQTNPKRRVTSKGCLCGLSW